MIFIYKIELYCVKTNHRTEYLGQSRFCRK